MAGITRSSISGLLQKASVAGSGHYSDILNPETIEPMIWKTLLAMQAQAALLTPVDSGLLRDSITIATNKNKNVEGSRAMFNEELESPSEDYVGVIGTNVEYAGAVEFGRPDKPNYPAQPYLRPTLDWMKSKLGRISGEELRAQFRAYANRHPHKTTEIKA